MHGQRRAAHQSVAVIGFLYVCTILSSGMPAHLRDEQNKSAMSGVSLVRVVQALEKNLLSFQICSSLG